MAERNGDRMGASSGVMKKLQHAKEQAKEKQARLTQSVALPQGSTK